MDHRCKIDYLNTIQMEKWFIQTMKQNTVGQKMEKTRAINYFFSIFYWISHICYTVLVIPTQCVKSTIHELENSKVGVVAEDSKTVANECEFMVYYLVMDRVPETRVSGLGSAVENMGLR